MFGKSAKVAKKDSTRRLEEYLVNKIAGRGSKVPNFSEQQKREIKRASEQFGLQEGLHLMGYRVRKATGREDENNFLRLSIARGFAAFYDGGVKREHIDELISRLPALERYDLIAGVTRLDPYFVDVFEEYAEELENRRR